MNRHFFVTACAVSFLISNSAWAQSGLIISHVIGDNGVPVADAVVVAVPDGGPPPLPKSPRTEIMDQVDKEFVPKVEPILVGSLVQFPNKDNVRHQVYSFSLPKTFELPLYAGTPSAPMLFDKPGVVVLGCNIHDWMLGYIYVSESPYFAKTDVGGVAEIHLPVGAYKVRVWHPQLQGTGESTQQSVQVSTSTQLSWNLKLKREIRVRRAPAAGNDSLY